MKNYTLKLSLLLLFGFITSSTLSQNDSNRVNLFKCINDSLSFQIENAMGVKDFDYINLIENLETLYLKNGLIKEVNKKNYIQAFKSLKISDLNKNELNVFNEQEKLFDKTGFLKFSTFTIFGSCPYKIYKNPENDKDVVISKQFEILDSLYQNGYDNFSIIKNLIETTNESQFSDIELRSPTILLMAINIDYKYNEKTKKFLKVKVD